jgi:hypothetical protein
VLIYAYSKNYYVIPAQAGIQGSWHVADFLDSRFHGNDNTKIEEASHASLTLELAAYS